MKDSFLMRYDPNTGANCFYTADMSSYTIFGATTTISTTN